MAIVSTKLMGGLGNYLFQISTAYSLSLRDNKELLCDYSDILNPHKSYEHYLNNIFRKLKFVNGIPGVNHFGEKNFKYDEIPEIQGDVKIFGYFQSEKYFIKYRKEILDLFGMDENTNQKITNKYGGLLDKPNCSIHVRRGDYLGLPDYHPTQTIDYYKRAINVIGNDTNFFIFSDDLPWCMENFNFLENKTFVSNNLDYEDLYLMSMCDDNIIANSTFSWWGSWLNKNKNKRVIVPSKWFGIKNNHLNTDDLYCNNWIKL